MMVEKEVKNKEVEKIASGPTKTPPEDPDSAPGPGESYE